MRRIVILGSTGSIGRSALEILKRAREEFSVVGLAAGNNVEELARQLGLFPEARFSLRDGVAVDALVRTNGSCKGRSAGFGEEGIDALIRETKPDLVINALVGISGLVPTMAALELGCTVALANKETLVTAGELVSRFVADDPARLIPIDSEHFSLSRCLRGYRDETVEIILTASGGPFYGRRAAELAGVTVAEVLDHPTWKMGPKVTVDSANLLNKGLEVIEAHWLFGFPYSAIKVVVHPQSIVHSIVRLRDGSLIAHLASADMKLPIMSALHYPEVREFPWSVLGLDELGRLEFTPLARGDYPAFSLALAAAERGGTAPAVLNAADEVAVEAFLAGRIGFLSIVSWIEEALGAHEIRSIEAIDDVLAADRWTREFLAGRHREASVR
ncbi:MAG: 1-deoxy-D-xylulose-5-phosphate reductoisomerase [Candidatus Krumholzibacteriaceae bacterium]|jgi:1-deoxy-D-xylulose-5-phosphate reductoisomerase